MGGGRANIEKQLELEPIRMKTVEEEFRSRGFEPIIISTNEINFVLNGNMIKVFPYSGWHQGKGIKPDCGLRKIYTQLDHSQKESEEPEVGKIESEDIKK